MPYQFTADILGTAPEDYVKSHYKIRPLLKTDKNSVVEWLRESHLIENYCQALEGRNSTYLLDIISEIYLLILEIPDDKWEDLVNQGPVAIRAYITGIIYRNINSNTSSIYLKYKKIARHQVQMTDDLWCKYFDTGLFPKTDEKISVQERLSDEDIIKISIENETPIKKDKNNGRVLKKKRSAKKEI